MLCEFLWVIMAYYGIDHTFIILRRNLFVQVRCKKLKDSSSENRRSFFENNIVPAAVARLIDKKGVGFFSLKSIFENEIIASP